MVFMARPWKRRLVLVPDDRNAFDARAPTAETCRALGCGLSAGVDGAWHGDGRNAASDASSLGTVDEGTQEDVSEAVEAISAIGDALAGRS